MRDDEYDVCAAYIELFLQDFSCLVGWIAFSGESARDQSFLCPWCNWQHDQQQYYPCDNDDVSVAKDPICCSLQDLVFGFQHFTPSVFSAP